MLASQQRRRQPQLQQLLLCGTLLLLPARLAILRHQLRQQRRLPEHGGALSHRPPGQPRPAGAGAACGGYSGRLRNRFAGAPGALVLAAEGQRLVGVRGRPVKPVRAALRGSTAQPSHGSGWHTAAAGMQSSCCTHLPFLPCLLFLPPLQLDTNEWVLFVHKRLPAIKTRPEGEHSAAQQARHSRAIPLLLAALLDALCPPAAAAGVCKPGAEHGHILFPAAAVTLLPPSLLPRLAPQKSTPACCASSSPTRLASTRTRRRRCRRRCRRLWPPAAAAPPLPHPSPSAQKARLDRT